MKTHTAYQGSGQDMLATALALLSIGLSPVLLKPGQKEPQFKNYTQWQCGVGTASDLELPEHKRPLYLTPQVIEAWFTEYPTANIGVLTRDIPAIDVDDESAFHHVAHVVPSTRVWKRGARGWTMFYRPSLADPILRTRTFASKLNKDHMLLEVLAAGRYTVLPPSIHPDTGKPYYWDQCAGLPPVHELPELRQADVDAIEEAFTRANYLAPRLVAARADDGEYFANRDRYAMWYGRKLADKLAIVTSTEQGGRQQALNDAVLSMAAGVRVGALSQADLEAEMRHACQVNGFYQERGEKLWFRDFAKALDDGWENELPDLGERTGQDPHLSAAEVFAGRPAPTEMVRGEAPPPPTVLLADANDFMDAPAPAREWCVLDVVPKRQITLLYGEPGKGKTTLAMQLAVQASRGGMFFGKPVAPHKRVLFIAAEDDRAEIHHRMAEVCRSYGIPKANVLFLIMDEQEAEITDLSTVVGDRSKPTPMMEVVEGIVRDHGVDLVFIDPVGDVFGGNENDKLQVRSFMQMLRRRLCVALGATVILMAHPSRGSAAKGDGQAGSTAWSGSARARLFFEEDRDSNGVMRLSLQKANRSGRWEATMRWVKGVFVGFDAKSEPDAKHPCQDAILEELGRMRCLYRADPRAGNWIGNLFEKHTGKALNTKEGKAEVKGWVLKWTLQGLIQEVKARDHNRMERMFIDIIETENCISQSETTDA